MRALFCKAPVALGFGMNPHEVLKAGRSGFIYTAQWISFALLAGLALGKVLQVRGKRGFGGRLAEGEFGYYTRAAYWAGNSNGGKV